MIARALNALAFTLGLPFCVPLVGRAAKWIWTGLLTLVWALAALPALPFGVKKLRVRVVILRDEAGEPVAAPGDLEPHLRDAEAILLEGARVQLVRHDAPIEVASAPSQARVLEPDCGVFGSLVEDLTLPGARLELLASRHGFSASVRRLLGYGAPVVVVVVRGFASRHLGCSLGPFADYVTVSARKPVCIAHELGHACGLPHSRAESNLMFRRCGRRELTRLQAAVIRSSRHVTHF